MTGVIEADSGEGGAAVGVAKYTGATAAAKQVTGAAKNLSWLMIVLGIFHFILRITITGRSEMTFVLSLALFIFAGYALAQRLEKNKIAILIPMLIFIVWYFIFAGNYDPLFLLYFGLAVAAISVIFGLFSKGESVKPELYGFLPVLFFFLDIGLLPFLVERLNWPITSLVENLILFMPWWAFFGLLTLPSEPTSSGAANALINITRILGIVYIVFVFVAPALPNVGYDSSLLPGTAEFEEAQARLRERLPKKENPAWSNIRCLMEGRYTDLQVCINQRQEKSEMDYICEKQEGYTKGTDEFNDCIKEQKEKRSEALKVGGVVDPTIKLPTKAELIVDKTQLPLETESDLGYPVELKIDNPREQEIGAELFCNFTAKGTDKKSFFGTIEPEDFPIKIKEEEFRTTFICYPPKDEKLNGTYTLTFGVKLSGLNTVSRLQRAFIGEKTPEQKKKLAEETEKVIKIKQSQAPNDLARINFDLGHSKEDIIIEDHPYRKIVLRANIENVGKGKILAVDLYNFNLEGFTFLGEDTGKCRSGPIGKVTYKQKIPLRPCIVGDYPLDLKNPEDWVAKTFEASLDYSYLVISKIDITAKPSVFE